MAALCISLTEPSNVDIVDRMTDLADLADVFEIRGDLVQEVDLLTLLRAKTRKLIFTARAASEGGGMADDDPRRHSLLHQAIRRGYDYVDIEYRSGFFDLMTEKAGKGLIVSFHDIHGTPQDLDLLYEGMCKAGADIVKIAVTPRTLVDVGRILTLMRKHVGAPTPLVAMALGPMGAITRILGPKFGSPLTYASAAPGHEAAPGQIPAADLSRIYRLKSINAETKVYGLLGSSVMRSLSPAMHNRGFEARGLNSVFVPLQADSAAAFFEALPHLGLSGFSVTRPFKVEVADRVHSMDASSAQSRSVNTVSISPGGLLEGASTDGIGVIAPLLKRGGVTGKKVIILGAGGAARAAGSALRECGAKVRIVARDLVKAARVAGDVGGESGDLSDLVTVPWDILLNATPMGGGEFFEQTLVPAPALRSGAIVFDMVYDPLETRLLREAAEAGCVTISGFEMLLAQATAQFEIWTGTEAPEEAMSTAALLLIQARAEQEAGS